MSPKISQREEIYAYVSSQYGTDAEYLWARYPNYGVFRRRDSGKWYGIVMDVPRKKLGLSGEGREDILNVKVTDPLLLDMLIREEGFLPAYHMSKDSWVSVRLDGSVPLWRMTALIDGSYEAVGAKIKRQKRNKTEQKK